MDQKNNQPVIIKEKETGMKKEITIPTENEQNPIGMVSLDDQERKLNFL